MTLPADIARRPGVSHDGEWREGCETCLRRTSSPHERQVWMAPPAVVSNWFEGLMACEGLIEPEAPK